MKENDRILEPIKKFVCEVKMKEMFALEKERDEKERDESDCSNNSSSCSFSNNSGIVLTAVVILN